MARNRPQTAGGGVQPGSKKFQYNKPSGKAPAPKKPTWTISGPIASTMPSGTARGPSGGGPSGEQTTDTADTADTTYQDWLDKQAAEERRLRTMNAITAMTGLMSSYGLSSLMDKIKGWITDGYEADAIMALIRTTAEYEQRFPAMKALSAKGRALSEAEYIAYEQAAAGYERLYGLPAGMLTSKEQISKLLTNEISARELEERTIKASQSQYNLPPEYRTMFRDYYNIDSGGLTAYFLDPDVAQPLLEKQFVSAQIGMEAALQGVGVGSSISEMLYQQGVNREQARQGFQQVAGSKELTTGRGDTVSQEELISGTMTNNAAAQAAIERAGASRVGRFQGGGSFAQTQQGVGGLGTATR